MNIVIHDAALVLVLRVRRENSAGYPESACNVLSLRIDTRNMRRFSIGKFITLWMTARINQSLTLGPTYRYSRIEVTNIYSDLQNSNWSKRSCCIWKCNVYQRMQEESLPTSAFRYREVDINLGQRSCEIHAIKKAMINHRLQIHSSLQGFIFISRSW